MSIVKKEFDYDEAPVRTIDQEIQQAQVKGRMDDIPIQGVVHEHPQDKVVVNVPIYFSPTGFICGECNNYMAPDGFQRNGKINVFCTNLYCSQNCITKIVSLPFSDDYIISSSEV